MNTAIVIVGANGQMGKTLAGLIAGEPDLALAGLVDREEHLTALAASGLPTADTLEAVLPPPPQAVIIDFSTPPVSLESARMAAKTGHALVIGTTGFTDEQIRQLRAFSEKTPIFWSSNMSVGVNVLLKILPDLAKALGEKYDIEIVELHHNRKKDSPSGTALMLGECLAQAREWDFSAARCSSRDGIIGGRPEKQIGVQAVRGGDVVGVHTIYFFGRGERIELCHQAHSRENFAQGALRAARWISGQKPGKLYGMRDMLHVSARMP
ncbi:MAG: 4-hydroxy-tetrahydrodipicolinate reductase [Desulfovibrio sp.]|jgi:4-hydroxy-tetrahydrodipicolinate reductase|nr:4-hydroxy-tetrahydrodipicolinate reductase [Desulfovibrio sp.]